MGQQGPGELNENGERLLSYCSANKLKVGGIVCSLTIHSQRYMEITNWSDCQPNGSHHCMMYVSTEVQMLAQIIT